MGYGVIDSKRNPFPPGTVLLEDKYRSFPDGTAPEFAHLKKDGDIILQPQPSDSPNDPLNWSTKRKTWIIGILMFVMVTMGGTAAMLNTAIRLIAEHYHTTFADVVKQLSSPPLAANAISLWLCSALAAVYGKRVQYVISMPILWLNLLAGFFANSLNYYKGVGIIGGIFGAPLELLLNPMITDMIFVHQRGRLMALSSIMSVLGIDIAHIVAGNIVEFLGYKYTFIISFGVVAPMVLLIYFFIWETTYNRPIVAAAVDPASVVDKIEQRRSQVVEYVGKGMDKPEIVMSEELKHSDSSSSLPNSPIGGGASEPKHSWAYQLKIFRGRLTDRSLVKALWQPFPLMIFPSVIFSTIINGAFLTWMVTAGIIAQSVLLYPPYSMRPSILAYIGLPGSAVALICAIISGICSDKIVVAMSRRNKGIYEPEFRLLMMIPATILSTIGFFTIGPAYAAKAPVIKIVGLGLTFYAAGPFATSACIPYIFDTQEKNTTEAMVATTLCKMLMMFFALQYVPAWYGKVGPIHAFQTLGWLNLAFALLTIPMYIFGKKARAAVARNNFLMKHTVVR